ncbi:MAG: hypothetical protein RL693_1654 [Verrucomicrobiota bacterium]|jgi:hypothetical protein
MNTEERATFILGQLNVGLRSELSQIDELETSLEKLLEEAKTRADAHIPAEKRWEWDMSWDAADQRLETMRVNANEARRRLNNGDTSDAMEPWKNITEEDRELDLLLDTLRRTGREALPGQDLDPWYDSWKGLWVTIEEHLTTLRLHVVTTHFQLEMRKKYGTEKADEVTQQILERLPENATIEDAEKFADEYRKAYLEFLNHREHPTFWDIFRGLLLMPEETPEDRLAGNRQMQKA